MEFLKKHQELSGYEFSSQMLKRGIHISNGSLYPILQELEEKGFIVSTTKGKKKIYRQTIKSKNIRNELQKYFPAEISLQLCKLRSALITTDWNNSSQIQETKNIIDDLSRQMEILIHNRKN